MLRRLIGTYHVSTPDSTIEHDIRTRAVENAGETWDSGYADRMVATALKFHHENQAVYEWVMGDHSGWVW
jgi:hypothetical protein